MPETATEVVVGKRWIELYESLPIINYPDPTLRIPGTRIEIFDDRLKTLAWRMAATMYNSRGVGLAAPQVAESLCLVLIDPWQDDRDPIFAVNPELITWDGYVKREEGCLSIPGFAADVERAFAIHVRYFDLNGALHEEEYSEFPAVVFQHEIDHLAGILFPDRVGSLRRRAFLKEFGLERRSFHKPVSLASKS